MAWVRMRDITALLDALDAAQEHACVKLVADIRFACGDNGRRMQPELVEFIRELAVDAERYAWLKQHDVGIGNEGYGDWTHYAYADAEPKHGRLGLDATIDSARTKEAAP